MPHSRVSRRVHGSHVGRSRDEGVLTVSTPPDLVSPFTRHNRTPDVGVGKGVE